MSPAEVSVPLTTRSELMMEGSEERPARFIGGVGAAAAAAAAAAVSFLLENMSTSLNKGSRIANDIVVPDLIMHMSSGAASRRSEPTDRCAFADLSAYLDKNR